MLFLKFCINLSVVTLLLFAALMLDGKGVQGGSVNVENNVRAKANTGGNKITGSGEIKTGDATAKSSVKTNVSGEEINVKTEASAEANGEKAEVNAESNGENVDIHKETGDEGSQASADVNVNANTQNNKGIISLVISSVKNAVENLFNKVISFFV